MASHDSFDIERLYKLFHSCIKDDDTIDMDEYVNAYEELSKLFGILGSVFSFVNSDVVEKVGILRDYRKSPEAADYETFEKMIKYEVANKITDNKKKASGSRTLLRLHRALEFTSRLMHDVKAADEHGKMSHITKEAYDATLSKHHPWLIRKGVHVAVYTLPTRKHFIEKLQAKDPVQGLEYLGKTADIQQRIFDVTEAIYTRENLHGLP
ncbi:ceramide-1-phosphate transfer protein-like [Mytilus edulis]|uniref:Glycolipid transfer protein domain-containing protein n=1 Tax=Mytilus edulis TaxID=6550 RepID=A0A8S3UVR4_MYTED|nr:unnamed protein product [Mytilus edulis]